MSNQARDQSRAGRLVETTEPSGLEDIGETLFDKGQATRERSDEHLDVPSGGGSLSLSNTFPMDSTTIEQSSHCMLGIYCNRTISFSIGRSSYLRSLIS